MIFISNLDYNRKYSLDELSLMDPIDTYKVILFGKYNRKLPNRFWEGSEGLDRAVKIVYWLIVDYLDLKEDNLKDLNLCEFFKEYKLNGMITNVFNGVAFDAINLSVPNRFNMWKFKRTPNSYWDRDKAIMVTKWLIEEELKLSDEEIKILCSYKLFKDNGLAGMIQKIYNSSAIDAVMDAYPNKFKIWEFNQVPKSYWNRYTGSLAVKWLVEEKLKLTDRELKNKLSCSMFEDNGLCGMLSEVFNYSPFEAIDNAYPGKFRKSDFKNYFSCNS